MYINILTGDIFHFPRKENKKLGYSTNKSTVNLDRISSICAIKEILEEAKKDALKDAQNLGISFDLTKISEEALCEIIIRPTFSSLDSEEIFLNDDETEEISEAYEEEIGRDDTLRSDDDDLDNDLSLFTSYKDLHIKDYVEKKTKAENLGLFLNVTVNGNKHLVKKSTLIWLLTNRDCQAIEHIVLEECPHKSKQNQLTRRIKKSRKEIEHKF